MVDVRVGTVSLSEYLTDYNISQTLSQDTLNTEGDVLFTDVNGEKIYGAGGGTTTETVTRKTTVSCVMEKVPNNKAEEIAGACKNDNTISLSYSTPITTTGNFRCTRYDAEARRSPGGTFWNITAVFEAEEVSETTTSGSSGSDGL